MAMVAETISQVKRLGAKLLSLRGFSRRNPVINLTGLLRCARNDCLADATLSLSLSLGTPLFGEIFHFNSSFGLDDFIINIIIPRFRQRQ
jgi:hypothetical protein